MIDDAKPDLSFATNEELISELMNRHDGVIVVREKCLDAKGQRSETLFDFEGGVSRALGLVERMRNYLLTTDWSASLHKEE